MDFSDVDMGNARTFKFQGHVFVIHEKILQKNLYYFWAATNPALKAPTDLGSVNFSTMDTRALVPMDHAAFGALVRWAYTRDMEVLLTLRSDLFYWHRVAVATCNHTLRADIYRQQYKNLKRSAGHTFARIGESCGRAKERTIFFVQRIYYFFLFVYYITRSSVELLATGAFLLFGVVLLITVCVQTYNGTDMLGAVTSSMLEHMSKVQDDIARQHALDIEYMKQLRELPAKEAEILLSAHVYNERNVSLSRAKSITMFIRVFTMMQEYGARCAYVFAHDLLLLPFPTNASLDVSQVSSTEKEENDDATFTDKFLYIMRKLYTLEYTGRYRNNKVSDLEKLLTNLAGLIVFPVALAHDIFYVGKSAVGDYFVRANPARDDVLQSEMPTLPEETVREEGSTGSLFIESYRVSAIFDMLKIVLKSLAARLDIHYHEFPNGDWCLGNIKSHPDAESLGPGEEQTRA